MNTLSDSNQNTQDKDAPDEKPARRSFRKWIVALAILAAIGGIIWYLHARNYQSTDDAFIEGHIVPISPRVAGHVAEVYITDNQWVKAGDRLVRLAPEDFEAKLKADQANLAAARAAYESSRINVNLTSTTSGSSLEEAKANVQAAKALVEEGIALASAATSQRDKAKAEVESSKAALAQARAEVVSASAAHQRDAQDLARIRDLASQGVSSQQQLEHAEATESMSSAALAAVEKEVETHVSDVQQSEAGLKAAEDNLRQAQKQVGTREAQLQESQARLAAAESAPDQVAQSESLANVSQADIMKAEAEVEQASLNLSYTLITSPTDGFVTKRTVEQGAYVQVGQTLLAIVPSEVWVLANFKENQLTRMKPGQPATIEVDAYPGVEFKGHVDSIQRGTGSRFSLLPAENATGNFVKVVQRVPVKIVFDEGEPLHEYFLAPGLSVVPKVNVGTNPEDGSD